MKPLLLAMCAALLICACGPESAAPTVKPTTPASESSPTLADTITWMDRALTEHNSRRHDPTQISLHLTDVGNCVVQETRLTTEKGSEIDTVRYDLSDIDPTSITLKPIGNITFIQFKTTDLHPSIWVSTSWSTHPSHWYDVGDFALNSEMADSFAKALRHAVELCGGKRSSF